jgi:hypothetical protein
VIRAAPPRGAHCGSGGTRSTGQTGLNRTVPVTPDPAGPAIVVVDEVEGGTVRSGAGDVVVRTVGRTVTTDAAATVEVDSGGTDDVVVSGVDGAAGAVVVVASSASRAWPPHAAAPSKSPPTSNRAALPHA